MKKEEAIIFKGRGDGLELVLDEKSEYTLLRNELSRLLQTRKSFFNSENMKIKISGKPLDEYEQADLSGLLKEEFGMGSVEFSASKSQIASMSELFFKNTITPNEKKSTPNPPPVVEQEIRQSAFLCHTVRSGQRIEVLGDIVVIGDVNPGAELVAGGSIAVMGTMRGLAHAGAYGDENAVVAANTLSAMQLRIAAKIAISPENAQTPGYAEVARIRKGKIVIEPIEGARLK